jgi:hypothetical protein
MTTHLDDTRLDAAEEDEEAMLERLRAAGVQPGDQDFSTIIAWEPVKQRPRWLAFLVRTLKLDHD